MKIVSGDLGPTATYTRREYRFPAGLGWHDGRDGTLWLETWNAKRRRGTKTTLSRYAVGEVKLIGFMGRAFQFDKEFPDDEHDEEERDNMPKSPYTVRVDQHGQIWCSCMGSVCRSGDSCRHMDLILHLLGDGALEPQEIGGS
jgi:hypothetical protein